jgi:hypothetical protein
MSNRHQRRAELSDLKRQARVLVTHMVPASACLDDHPLLLRARRHYQDGIEERHAQCVGCKVRFTITGEAPAAFLFAEPVNVGDIVATSALCAGCWQTLPMIEGELDRVATRVLRAVVPGGRFLDDRDASP